MIEFASVDLNKMEVQIIQDALRIMEGSIRRVRVGRASEKIVALTEINIIRSKLHEANKTWSEAPMGNQQATD